MSNMTSTQTQGKSNLIIQPLTQLASLFVKIIRPMSKSLVLITAMIFGVLYGNLTAQIVITPTVTKTTCATSCDGAIDLVVSGGKRIWNGTDSVYNYTWAGIGSGGGNTTVTYCLTGPAGATSQTATGVCNPATAFTDAAIGLCPGTYTVTVKDANNVTATTIQTVLAGTMNKMTVATDASTTTCVATCTGIIKVNATGGNPPYTYSWSGSSVTGDTRNGLCAGSYTVKVSDSGGTLPGCDSVLVYNIGPTPSIVITGTPICAGGSTTLTATGGSSYTWAPGGATGSTISVNPATTTTYTVTATNAGCPTSTATYTLTVNPAVTATTTPTNVLCNGGTTGSIAVTPGGGTSPFTYAWTGGQTAATATNLGVGSYTVTVTDNKGCATTSTASITEPVAITLSAPTVKPACGGSTGSAVATATGGTGTLTYVWVGAVTGQTNSNLSAGSYGITVTDGAGCTKTDVVAISNNPQPSIDNLTGNPPLCKGNSNGTAAVVASGGTAPLTYAWSNGKTGVTGVTGLSGSTVGTIYIVTVTDANGCLAVSTVTITEPTVVTATSTPVNSNCGQPDGSVSVTPGGGTPAYTYLWTGGATTQTSSGLLAGPYTVTVTDSKGCTVTTSATISTQNPGVASTTKTNIMCNGGTNGTVVATLTGGTATTYAWGPSGGTGQTASNLSAGTYTVTITDSNNCTATSTAAITEPTAVTATPATTPAICIGATGTATVAPGGGTSPYVYLWSYNSITTATATGLTSGSYTVTVTDANGCTKSTTATVGTTNGAPTAATSVVSNVLCNGGNTGSVSVTMTGGTAAFTYAWSSGGTAQTESGLAQGSYTVTITDANGCATSSTVSITEPTAGIASTNSTPATCGGSNGTASVSVVGGTPGYTYAWPAPGNQTGTSATGLAAGSYAITITDANGCTGVTTAIVGNAGGGIANISTGPAISCNGGTNGTASATLTGGTAVSYLWSNSATTQTITNLSQGTYIVTITDNSGCLSISSVAISEPPAISGITATTSAPCGTLSGTASVTPSGGTGLLTLSWMPGGATSQTVTGLGAGNYTVTITDGNGCTNTAVASVSNAPAPSITSLTAPQLKCNGGNNGVATVIATGGSGTLTYTWSNSGPTGTGATSFTGLSAGNYAVTVTDASGCQAVSNVNVTEPNAITATTSTTFSTCGSSNGSATIVTTNGGTGAYTYLWSAPGAQTGTTATGLAAGLYSVTITDANGCTATTTANVVNSNGGVVNVSSVSPITCFGASNGSISTTVAGGTPGYTYLWSNSATGQTVNNLGQGTYSVTVTDNNGCTSSTSVTLSEPIDISNITSKVDASCGNSNGTASVVSSGGTGALTYIWSSAAFGQTATGLIAGSYTVSVTDGNNCVKTSVVAISDIPGPVISNVSSKPLTCNGDKTGSIDVVATGNGALTYKWSNGAVGVTSVSGLLAGPYVVTVTDAAGCSAVSTVSITEPSAITNVFTLNNSSCGLSTGSAVSTASGGTPPFNYVWSNATIGATNSNLAANTYTVIITDANGCTLTSVATISNNGGPSVTSLNPTNVLCNGGNTGTAIVSITGGSSPYTYIWSGGATTVTSSVSNTINTLTANTYTVTVNDANNCQTISTVTVTEPTAITAPTFTTSGAACGLSNGSAIATVSSGGIAPYTYSWSNLAVGATISNLAAGNYTVTVKDVNGCTKTASTSIITYNGPQALTSSTGVLCNGGSTGTATVTITGGSAPYTYSWSTGSTSVSSVLTSTISGLAVNTYTVTVMDTKGCTVTSTVSITQPAAMGITQSSKSTLCGSSNGSVKATVAGGTPLYTYSWSNGSSTATSSLVDSLKNLASGSYSVTITDANGCSVTTTSTVGSISTTVLNVVPAQQTISEGTSFAITVTGGVTYTWSPAEGLSCTDCPNPVASPTVTTTYTVIAIDKNGCTATAQIHVTVRQDCTDESDVYIANIFSPNNDGKNDILYIQGNGLTNIYWAIYDRWGNLLFESFKQSDGWDGTRKGSPMESGVYVWYLKATCIKSNTDVKLKGNTSIVK